MLKPAHVRAHLKFANGHLDDAEEGWEKVMWHDGHQQGLKVRGRGSTITGDENKTQAKVSKTKLFIVSTTAAPLEDPHSAPFCLSANFPLMYQPLDLINPPSIRPLNTLQHCPVFDQLQYCSLGIQYIRHILAFVFTIEEINLRRDILPNITLGFQAHDSGPSEALTIERALRILSGGRKVVENFSCSKQGKIIAFIGHLLSSPSYALADLLSVYKYVQVSYGASDPVFDDKGRFPQFFRTVPCQRAEYFAIIHLLKHFNWSWVGIVTDEGNMGGSEEMKLEIIRSGYCVEFMVTIQWNNEQNLSNQIHRSTTNSPRNKKNMKNVDPYQYDLKNFRQTYKVYTAVYAIAHALHDMIQYQAQQKKTSDKKDQNHLQLFKMRHYMQRVKFPTESGDVFFDDKGNPPGHFDILNFIVYPNVSLRIETVGSYFEHEPSGEKLRISKGNITWNAHYTQIPKSVCTESCLPGYRKATSQSNQICCYDCVRCSEGEITNTTDMTSCEKCPEDQRSNENMDRCVPKKIEFLSFHDVLGITLTATSVLFFAVAAGVSVIVFIHRHVQIVRANNRVLSYILLASLKLSFLCCLLFIVQPGNVTCLLRQISFGLIFAVALSTILGKTVTVIIVFNATKPGSKMKKLVGTKVAKTIVVSTSLGQVCICAVWLICSPPFPEAVFEMEEIVLQCNEGSALAFYVMVGYIGVLALISFALAYFARTLPNIYNEAQLITFSMLVFCSVWISFIPANLSTKGKHMVVVKIFTILASSAGLLGCIFFPKCYIIMVKSKAMKNKKQVTQSRKIIFTR
ncbi:vomeronasal type-2 receptor 26-like [Leptodactylus fuscus]